MTNFGLKPPKHVRIAIDVYMLSDADVDNVIENMLVNLEHHAILKAELVDSRPKSFEREDDVTTGEIA